MTQARSGAPAGGEPLQLALERPALKQWDQGTYRAVDPRLTVERMRPLFGPLGITRIANVTGLDNVGIPVVMVVRPNAKSLAVSQGKGLTLDAAKASGVMESIELYHAEHIEGPLLFGSVEQLGYRHPLVDVTRLNRLSNAAESLSSPMLWMAGWDLASGSERWVPYEVVHTDFTVEARPYRQRFCVSSNGLASGNNAVEATLHGLAEVIERDAVRLHRLSSRPEQDRRLIDLASVPTHAGAACADLLARFEAAGIDVVIWDVTSDIGIACFEVLTVPRDISGLRVLPACEGFGCHPDRSIALSRALTEAAQSRLTFIAGSRDDNPRDVYTDETNRDRLAAWRQHLDGLPVPGRSLAAVPTWSGETANEDLRHLVDQVTAAGLPEIVVVDLSKAALGVPVVRVVVPGLEPHRSFENVIPGARAQRVLGAA